MEIPYTVRSRPDTGLYNAKMGIWLFLASEVMLFGGLFSSYIFLRLKAHHDPEYFWPENALTVLPGFINTIILIASSVTVLMAWASLKMHKWRQFQFYMATTIICAIAFLCLKAYEYSGKFSHYGFLLEDGSRIEAHIHDQDTMYNGITGITVDPSDPDLSFLKNLKHGAIEAPTNHDAGQHGDDDHHPVAESKDDAKPIEFTLDGEPFQVTARALREHAKEHKEELAKQEPAEEQEDKKKYVVTLVPVGEVGLDIPSKQIASANDGEVLLKSGARISGTRLGEFYELAVDQVDLRVPVVRVSKDLPEAERLAALSDAVDNSRALALLPEKIANEFNQNREEQLQQFRESYPEHDEHSQHESLRLAYMMNPEKDEDGHYPHMTLPASEVTFNSNLTPKYNTYYAIYFTLTGLHGLHVIGGIVVLGYFLFRGKKLYDTDPERMANRVEVGGLFWHFVDLVWIFLFPLMYLL